MLASRRARQISQGADPLVPAENDKPTVIALREIAEGLVTAEGMDSMEAKRALERLSTDDELVRQIAQASLNVEQANAAE